MNRIEVSVKGDACVLLGVKGLNISHQSVVPLNILYHSVSSSIGTIGYSQEADGTAWCP